MRNVQQRTEQKPGRENVRAFVFETPRFEMGSVKSSIAVFYSRDLATEMRVL